MVIGGENKRTVIKVPRVRVLNKTIVTELRVAACVRAVYYVSTATNSNLAVNNSYVFVAGPGERQKKGHGRNRVPGQI